MKNLKKVLSLALVVVMIFALGATALAADTTITIDESSFAPATPGTYHGFRLLDAITVENEGADDTYSYSVNPEFRVLLQSISGATTDQEIIAYINGLTGSAAIREFANDVFDGITTETFVEFTGGVARTVPEGYWLIADVTGGEGYSTSNVILNTAGESTLTVTPKKSIPDVEKDVYEDSTQGWGKVADYDIGDPVPFRLTATIPAANIAEYDSYTVTFYDTLSTGLSLNGDMTLSVNGGVAAAITPTAPAATGETFSYEVAITPEILAGAVNGNVTLVIEYTATLNSAAVIYEGSNPNKVYLTYTNNPNGTQGGKTEDKEVLVYTYEIDVFKYTEVAGDEEAARMALAGAKFRLFSDATAANEIGLVLVSAGDDTAAAVYRVAVTGETPVEMITPVSGLLQIQGLDEGTYFLKETEAPAGYNIINEVIKVVISRTINEAGTAVTSVGLLIDEETIVVDSVDVENKSGLELPSTGGIGTTIFYIVGAALICLAVVLLIVKKRKNEATDN